MGTKLQVIITKMALEIMEHDDVVKGVPVVQPADKHFWFHNPKLLLNLINFVLFEVNKFVLLSINFFMKTFLELNSICTCEFAECISTCFLHI